MAGGALESRQGAGDKEIPHPRVLGLRGNGQTDRSWRSTVAHNHMQDKTSTARSVPANSLDATAATYRLHASSCLAASQKLAEEFPFSQKITEHSHSQFASAWNDDPRAYVETIAGLLVRKARLHVTAALRANQMGNMHSLAAQMRPALECAGQVVTTMQDLFEGSTKSKSAVRRRADADYYHTMLRVSRGHLGPQELLEDIANIHIANDESIGTKKGFYLQETVKDLEFGKEWYDHLSRCFYDTGIAGLKGQPYCGGIRPTNSAYDQIAFAILLDYLASQVLFMILHAAKCPPETEAKKQCYKQAAALIEKKRTVVDPCRDYLESGAYRNAARPGC